MDKKFYVLNGDHPIEGELQSFFTNGERATALAIAKLWLARDWKPFLFSKTAGGAFNVLLNFRNFEGKRKQAA